MFGFGDVLWHYLTFSELLSSCNFDLFGEVSVCRGATQSSYTLQSGLKSDDGHLFMFLKFRHKYGPEGPFI